MASAPTSSLIDLTPTQLTENAMNESFQTTVKATYERIRRDLLLVPMRPNLVPVHLMDEKFLWQGTGTLVLDEKNHHRHIITASHLFEPGQRKQWYYQILQPFSDNIFPIQSAAPLANTKEDVAVCIPGPLHLIEGFSKYPTGGVVNLAAYQGWPTTLPQPICTSLVTGKGFGIGGMIENPTQGRYYALDYPEAFSGESGTGFYTGNSKELLVLRGGFPAPEQMKRDFSLFSDKLCLATLIKLW